MSESTITIREKTITLKQITLPNGKIRPQVTIPKDKILFWIRAAIIAGAAGSYLSQDIVDAGGKLQLLDTTAEEAIRVTTSELDALDEGF